MSSKELRAKAREQLKGNWGKAIGLQFILLLVAILSAVLVAGAGSMKNATPISIVVILILIVVTGPITLGIFKFFLNIKRGEGAEVSDISAGFNKTGPSLLLLILISFFQSLWSLLFVIPGIIAGLRYSLAFFVMNDNPEMTAKQSLDRSKEMMKGNVGRLFCLYLSFIGWMILGSITFGLATLWVGPYMYTAFANFYDELKAQA